MSTPPNTPFKLTVVTGATVCRRFPGARVCRRPFSLVEMLVVIAIVGILFGAAMPMFDAILYGNSVKSSSRNVGSLMAVGRSYAMAKRRSVAIIMPGPNCPDLADKHRFRIARLAYVTNDSGTYTFDSWVEDSAWLYVPNGASIMEADSDIGIQDDVSYSRLPSDNDSTTVDNVDLSGALGGPVDVDGVRAVIFSGSGKLKGGSRYVTIGQAAYLGGIWKIDKAVNTPTNESCANQLTIEVNRFTGSISYIMPENY